MTIEDAIDAVAAARAGVPELETVEGRNLYDKHGKLVGILDGSRVADRMVDLVVHTEGLVDEAHDLVADHGVLHCKYDGALERIAELQTELSAARERIEQLEASLVEE